MKSRSVILMILALSCLAVLLSSVPQVIALVDRELFSERLRDIRAELFHSETWNQIPQLAPDLDYSWLQGPYPLRIGHALGAADSRDANELSALPAARAAKLKVLEVDIWLADDQTLRCFHGPGDPGPLLATTCTLERLIEATEPWQPWIVLDIKTDFSATSNAVAQYLKRHQEVSRRVIFQLYRPENVSTFKGLSSQFPLPGPIVTAYMSYSSLNTVARSAARAGVRVVTVPFYRSAALTSLPPGMRAMIHPVRSCDQQRIAESRQFVGVYTLSSLVCKANNAH